MSCLVIPLWAEWMVVALLMGCDIFRMEALSHTPCSEWSRTDRLPTMIHLMVTSGVVPTNLSGVLRTTLRPLEALASASIHTYIPSPWRVASAQLNENE